MALATPDPREKKLLWDSTAWERGAGARSRSKKKHIGLEEVAGEAEKGGGKGKEEDLAVG
jgi:hypothetical protein